MKRFSIILLLVAACTSQETPVADQETATVQPAGPTPPAAQQAREIIVSSPDFSEFEFTRVGFTVPVSGVAMSAPARISARELAAEGWLSMDPNGDISLTEKSRSDKRFILRPNGLLDIVPLAKKEMGDVTVVRANDDNTITADFTWRWIPNEVGSAFKTGLIHDTLAAEQDGKATLMWDGSRWSVLKIE